MTINNSLGSLAIREYYKIGATKAEYSSGLELAALTNDFSANYNSKIYVEDYITAKCR